MRPLPFVDVLMRAGWVLSVRYLTADKMTARLVLERVGAMGAEEPTLERALDELDYIARCWIEDNSGRTFEDAGERVAPGTGEQSGTEGE